MAPTVEDKGRGVSSAAELEAMTEELIENWEQLGEALATEFLDLPAWKVVSEEMLTMMKVRHAKAMELGLDEACDSPWDEEHEAFAKDSVAKALDALQRQTFATASENRIMKYLEDRMGPLGALLAMLRKGVQNGDVDISVLDRTSN